MKEGPEASVCVGYQLEAALVCMHASTPAKEKEMENGGGRAGEVGRVGRSGGEKEKRRRRESQEEHGGEREEEEGEDMKVGGEQLGAWWELKGGVHQNIQCVKLKK